MKYFLLLIIFLLPVYCFCSGVEKNLSKQAASDNFTQIVNYKSVSFIEKPTVLVDSVKYLKGVSDANKYYHKNLWWLMAGFFIGFFAIIFVAFAKPQSPLNSQNNLKKSKNKDIFRDNDYVMGFMDQTRIKNFLFAFLGTVAWSVFILIIAMLNR
ncbi:MAG: hypothetical protein JXL97_09665 [Bacteroidales bacterium]|nr:hypothetical protein [Bacteroidales bacterium]